jgi:hypothetical protein
MSSRFILKHLQQWGQGGGVADFSQGPGRSETLSAIVIPQHVDQTRQDTFFAQPTQCIGGVPSEKGIRALYQIEQDRYGRRPHAFNQKSEIKPHFRIPLFQEITALGGFLQAG